MKRFAALILSLILMFSLSATAFAAISAGEELIEGDAGGGLSEIAAEENDAAVQDRQEDFTEDSEPTESAPTEATEPETQPATITPVPAASTEDPAVNRTAIIVMIVCGAVLLILLVIIFTLLLRKKKPSDSGEMFHAVAGRGKAVQIEMISGSCWNEGLQFRLRRNLTVGTDHGCDLVFDDPRLLPMHAVISLSSGAVMISECADTGNTYVGGMKIFAPNRLRSGDIVTVGSTTFRIYFE